VESGGYASGLETGWSSLMPIVYQPLPVAEGSYGRESEALFRRELENYLLRLSSAVNQALSASEGEASPASKRESLLAVPGGVVTYGA
jgi:hypothetical protein